MMKKVLHRESSVDHVLVGKERGEGVCGGLIIFSW